jgi:hypothetical protein
MDLDNYNIKNILTKGRYFSYVYKSKFWNDIILFYVSFEANLNTNLTFVLPIRTSYLSCNLLVGIMTVISQEQLCFVSHLHDTYIF